MAEIISDSAPLPGCRSWFSGVRLYECTTESMTKELPIISGPPSLKFHTHLTSLALVSQDAIAHHRQHFSCHQDGQPHLGRRGYVYERTLFSIHHTPREVTRHQLVFHFHLVHYLEQDPRPVSDNILFY